MENESRIGIVRPSQAVKERKPYDEEHRKAVYGKTVCTV
jgi:hypothetical protein